MITPSSTDFAVLAKSINFNIPINILNGIGYEYDPMAVLIENQSHTMNLQEEQYMLMVHEQRIEQSQGSNNPQNQANLIQSTAYFATAETVYDSAWYADSGATNHVTSDLNNLTMPTEYQGRDRFAVGNGNLKPHSSSASTLRLTLQTFHSIATHLNIRSFTMFKKIAGKIKILNTFGMPKAKYFVHTTHKAISFITFIKQEWYVTKLKIVD
ncbi:hypothetical protein ACOSP7_005165 [Xanthoceras sorbifolium]